MAKKVRFPKVPKRGKDKNKKASSSRSAEPVAPSPLHEDEPPSRSSSRALRDKQREEQRRERDERRSKRDKRLDDSKASKKASKKKSRPKLSQEEQDAKDAKLGCCAKFAQFLAKAIHILDGCIGLTFVVYGALILTSFETPAMEAVYTSLIYGSTLLFASIMGIVGFYSTKCNRCGLAVSAYVAPFIALFYIVVIIAVLSSPDTFFDYLTEHKDVLYLTDDIIQTLRNLLPFFYIVLACLAAIEIVRFFGVRKIRHRLVRYDDASERILRSSLRSSDRSHRSSTRSNRSERSSSSKGSKRSKRSKQETVLTEPLLDEEMGGGADSSDEDSDW
ncbi:hypothetical protein ACHAXT_007565 [Thalassiosira profunda]